MIKVGILGASGFTGAELLRLLASHPDVEVTVVSRREGGQKMDELFPSLGGLFDLELISHAPERMASECDVAFCCMPHKAAMDMVPALLGGDAKVVDLSADFRFRDVKIYEEWYTAHAAADLLSETVYGLPELYRESIEGARLVATPGCYPTGAILAAAPLFKNDMVDTGTLIVDSKSGVSGAGAKPTDVTHYIEVNECMRAYGVASHRHTPEMEEHLSNIAGRGVKVLFTPHLTPMERGILTTTYAKLRKDVSTAELLDVYRDFYRGEHFIRIRPEGDLPRTKRVRGSNFVDIGAVADPRTGMVVAVSAIDNLTKGASGAAVQCMNIMMGLEETAGVDMAPLYP